MKLERLLAVTMLLLNRRRVSAQELAERFEVSLRTVYRDMEAINAAGIPVVSYTGAAGGYEIMEKYRVERQFLSYEELESIMIALRGVRSTLHERDIGMLLDKVGALAAKTERGSGQGERLMIDLDPWSGGEEQKALMRQLRGAADSLRLVKFRYTNGQGEEAVREVEPVGVVLKGYIWYLYAYCRLRGDYRIFRLSRVEQLTVLQATFERRSKELQHFDFRWGAQKKYDLVRLKLLFHPRAKARVYDYFDRDAIRLEPDGMLLVTSEQPDEPWLYGMLLGYGADVRVLGPEHVAREVRERAVEIVRNYDFTLP
ncbi:helix-turn-helix transcriptional regulator [Paenibacillus beijingensis]|uniref:DeoR faimly transcriptional regulator n=1 Tax=Paenibacillus beijingensis TaxID=1126833 RepID=A0A0D5NGK1_9BACL|nr:YafY family protein [Paenibacillus beijingensis]AJY74097.1 DeoR faimly transcriptional regulator [Paenibacillus beijingensis]